MRFTSLPSRVCKDSALVPALAVTVADAETETEPAVTIERLDIAPPGPTTRSRSRETIGISASTWLAALATRKSNLRSLQCAGGLGVSGQGAGLDARSPPAIPDKAG